MEQTQIAGLFDELEKIAVSLGALRTAANTATKASGRNLTMEAQALHRSSWMREQAAKKALAPRLKAYQASRGQTAMRSKPAKSGLLSSFFGKSRPTMARA